MSHCWQEWLIRKYCKRAPAPGPSKPFERRGPRHAMPAEHVNAERKPIERADDEALDVTVVTQLCNMTL